MQWIGGCTFAGIIPTVLQVIANRAFLPCNHNCHAIITEYWLACRVQERQFVFVVSAKKFDKGSLSLEDALV